MCLLIDTACNAMDASTSGVLGDGCSLLLEDKWSLEVTRRRRRKHSWLRWPLQTIVMGPWHCGDPGSP